jgi:predicted transcriptional regulator
VNEGRRLRRSKLEMYLDILGVLERGGQVKMTHIMYETNVNCGILNLFLDFLTKQNLAEKQTVGRQRAVYSITQKGMRVLEYFRELKQALPIMDENYIFLSVPL